MLKPNFLICRSLLNHRTALIVMIARVLEGLTSHRRLKLSLAVRQLCLVCYQGIPACPSESRQSVKKELIQIDLGTLSASLSSVCTLSEYLTVMR